MARSLSPAYTWNLSNLYTTGEVTLIAVAEPSILALVVFPASAVSLTSPGCIESSSNPSTRDTGQQPTVFETTATVLRRVIRGGRIDRRDASATYPLWQLGSLNIPGDFEDFCAQTGLVFVASHCTENLTE